MTTRNVSSRAAYGPLRQSHELVEHGGDHEALQVRVRDRLDVDDVDVLLRRRECQRRAVDVLAAQQPGVRAEHARSSRRHSAWIVELLMLRSAVVVEVLRSGCALSSM